MQEFSNRTQEHLLMIEEMRRSNELMLNSFKACIKSLSNKVLVRSEKACIRDYYEKNKNFSEFLVQGIAMTNAKRDKEALDDLRNNKN
jgi:hypothetical protein